MLSQPLAGHFSLPLTSHVYFNLQVRVSWTLNVAGAFTFYSQTEVWLYRPSVAPHFIPSLYRSPFPSSLSHHLSVCPSSFSSAFFLFHLLHPTATFLILSPLRSLKYPSTLPPFLCALCLSGPIALSLYNGVPSVSAAPTSWLQRPGYK